MPKPEVSMPQRYDRIMRAYDPGELELGIILKALDFKKDARVLEVGTGNGRVVFKMAPHVGEVYSIDNDREVLKVAQAQLERNQLKNVHISYGDIQDTPFEDGFFDAVLCPWVLHHVEDKDAAMKEVERVLKKGGAFLSIDVSPDNDYIPLKGIVKPKALEFVAKREEDVLGAIKNSALDVVSTSSFQTHYLLPTMEEVHMFFGEFDIPYRELDREYLTRFLEDRKTDGGYKIMESAHLTLARKV